MSVFTLTKQTRLPVEDLAGSVYDRWTVQRFMGRDERGNAYWKCRCSCGTIQTVRQRYLKEKSSRSCGCLQKELAAAQNRLNREVALPPPLEELDSRYRNGTRPYNPAQVLDQPSTRKRLGEMAGKLRPHADLLTATLRPGHGKQDSLARACAILALRTPTEEQLFDLRFALEFTGLDTLADSVWGVARGQTDPGQLNEVRRLLAEALSK